MERDYLGRVQVLRFFAASAVLFAHLQHEVRNHFSPGNAFHPFTLIDGGLGVDLFFVISGFIMYHVSANAFGTPGASRSFLVRRYMRIAPLYYFATLLMLVATFAFGSSVSIARPELGHVVSSFLFLPTRNSLGEVAPVLKLGWTLNFEVYFYLVFALALAFSRRIGLIVLTLVLGGVTLLAQIVPDPPVALAFWGQSLVFEFLGGIAIAALYHRGMRVSAAQGWLLIAAALALLVVLRVTGTIGLLPRGAYAGIPAWMIVLGVMTGPFDRHRGPLHRFLAAGGEASYAIYVMHPFGIRAGAMAWRATGLTEQPWAYITLLMVVVIAGAFAVNAVVERPLDRWLRGLRGHSARSPAPVAIPGT